MTKIQLNTIGMKCPLPILKIATIMPKVHTGDVLEIVGDCETFGTDIRNFCGKIGKVLTLLVKRDNYYVAEIQF